MVLFYSNVSNFTQNIITVWPKFDEGCWNYHMRAVSILPSGAKRNGKIVSDYFAVLAIILPSIWLLFCLSLENRHYLTYM